MHEKWVCIYVAGGEASGRQLAKWVITVFLHSNPVKQSYQDND